MTAPGVGTNRYAYSFNDPVNLRDPSGNCVWDLCVGEIALAGAFLFTGGAVIYSAQDHNTPNIWSTPVAAPIPALPPSTQGDALNLPNHTGNLNRPDVTDGRILADPVPVDLGGSMVSTPITPQQGVEVMSMVQPGHYVITGEQDGEFRAYIGKGDRSRMDVSMDRIRKDGGFIIDRNWEPSDSHRDAFKDGSGLD